jgi:hypothetical protein
MLQNHFAKAIGQQLQSEFSRRKATTPNAGPHMDDCPDSIISDIHPKTGPQKIPT